MFAIPTPPAKSIHNKVYMYVFFYERERERERSKFLPKLIALTKIVNAKMKMMIEALPTMVIILLSIC